MTLQDKKELKELLNYIKNNILYVQKVPPLLRKKINELALDKDDNFIYTYKMILYSFMINKSKIEYAFNTKTFENEKHKINYMMVIVSNSMNDIKNKVLLNMKNQSYTVNDKQNAQMLADYNILHGSNKYVRKTKELNSDKVEELW